MSEIKETKMETVYIEGNGEVVTKCPVDGCSYVIGTAIDEISGKQVARVRSAAETANCKRALLASHSQGKHSENGIADTLR